MWIVLLRADVGHSLGFIPRLLYRIVLQALVNEQDRGMDSCIGVLD